ncbi:MAG: ATP-binding cassette domain-containing protein [Tetrasphaera sp.]
MLAIFSRQPKHKPQTSPAWGQPVYAMASSTNGVAKPAPLIQIDHLVKEYDTGAGPLRVLHEAALTVWPGEFVAVVGASGSGKSTLINMITGIDRPTGGDGQRGRQPAQRSRRESDGALARAARGRDLPVLPTAAGADRSSKT